MNDRELPNILWGEACNKVVHILNHSPTFTLVNKTPYEAWHGVQPEVSSIRVFGCIAYAFIPSQQRRNFDEKEEKFIFISNNNESKGYRLYSPITKSQLFQEIFLMNFLL